MSTELDTGGPTGVAVLLDRLKAIAARAGGVSAASSERLSRRLALSVFVGGVVLVAHELAALTWALVPQPELSAVGDTSLLLGSKPSHQVALDVEPIVRAQLFGRAGGPVQTPRRGVDAPETKLNLELHGVFFSPETQEARAIISAARGEDLAYAVGDALPGGATIEEVQVDRVLLRRNGRLEVLRLPKDQEAVAKGEKSPRASRVVRPGGGAASRRVDYRSNRQLAKTLGRYRRQLQRNPERLSDLAQLRPELENGQLVGYKLGAGKDSRLLNRFGLRSGDLLVAVNGINLDEPAKGLDALKELSGANELNVDVLRNGNRLSFSFRVEP